MKVKTKSKKKYAIHRKYSVLASLSTIIESRLQDDIKAFLDGGVGVCYVCGLDMEQEHRHHHLCSDPCRREWYKGRLRPAKES